MESRIPLLSDQKHAKVLKLIREIRADRAAGKNTRADSKFLRVYSANRRPTSDAFVLSALLRLTNSYYHDSFDEIIASMQSAPSEYPSNAVLTAVELLLQNGRTDDAAILLGGIQSMDDLGRFAYLRGRLSQLKGNTEDAKMHYMTSFRAEPYRLALYEGLNAVDPGFGWAYVGEMMSLRQGIEATPVRGAEGPMQELSAIYSAWMRGDRANSMSAMLASEAYNSGDPFYRLVYAWMCVSDGRYRKAVRSYIDAVRGFDGGVAFLVEMADIQDRMGESEDSEIACRRALDLDGLSDRAVAQLGISQLHQGKVREAVTTMEAVLKLPAADARICARCIDALWSSGRITDANSLFRKLVGRCSDEAYGLYLTALNDNRNGSFQAARRAAEAGIKQDPDSVPCICQLAVALAGMGRVEEALAGLRAKRPVFMDDIRLLDTEKDILIKAGEYNSAIELCDSILDTDPRNADVMRDKANAYRLKADYVQAVSCYRESLNIREDLRLFISVLEMLLESSRTDDLCRLVDDFDDAYGSSAVVWRLRGNAEYMAERYEDAVISFSKASAIVTNDIDIWHSRGMAEEMAGMYADAEASYDRAVILDLEDTDCWISKAVVQEKQGNITGAIDSLNRVISVSSDHPYALAMKGRLLARLGRYREARYFLNLSYTLDTTNTKVLEMILRILVHEGETEEAVTVGRKVLDRNRGSYLTMIALAEIYAENGNREEALGMLNDAMPYISGDRAAAERCARAYHSLMCWNEEMDIYRSLLAQYPGDRDLMMAYAEALSASGDKDGAAKVYTEMEALNPEDADIAVRRVMVSTDVPETEKPSEDGRSLMELAKSLVDSGRNVEAIDILRKIVESCPEDPEPYLYTAYVMANQGMFDDSMAVIKKARAMFPADARILLSLGTLKERHGDPAGALAAYNDAARLGMVNHDLFLAMGRIRYDMGMLSPAIEALQEAIRLSPEDGEARLLLSEALIRAGRGQESVSYLLTIINDDPGNVRALRAYVEAVDTTEGLLAVYDAMLAADRTPEDTEAFRRALIKAGETAKADALLPEEEEEYDPLDDALRVLDTAYADGKDMSDPAVYGELGLSGERMEAVLDLLTMQVDYEPHIGTSAYEEMERMSNETIVSEDLRSIECNRVVPIQTIRHATGCASIEKMYRLQKHIELSFSVDGVDDSCMDTVDSVIADMEDTGSATLFDIMSGYNLGIMTARMVLNRISDQ